MLTKEDLLTCSEAPNMNDISLELYRDFAETYLIPRRFHYDFIDGDTMDLRFTEWGIYHMLSIHHIDHSIKKNRFFQRIKDGLSFSDFEVDRGKKLRLKKEKKRITMFSCVYNSLVMGTMFYLPSGHVRNTAEVDMDYISHMKMKNNSPTGITYNGINIGIRKCDDVYVPLTVLVSSHSNLEEYIRNEEIKLVKKLCIIDEQDNIIDEKNYSFIMQ